MDAGVFINNRLSRRFSWVAAEVNIIGKSYQTSVALSSAIFLSGPNSMRLSGYTTPEQQQGNKHVGNKEAQCSMGIISPVIQAVCMNFVFFFILCLNHRSAAQQQPSFCSFEPSQVLTSNGLPVSTHTMKLLPDHTHDGLCMDGAWP